MRAQSLLRAYWVALGLSLCAMGGIARLTLGSSLPATQASAHTLEYHTQEPSRLSDSWQDAQALTMVFHFDEQRLHEAARAIGAFPDDVRASAAVSILAQQLQKDVGGAPVPHVPISPDTLARGLLSQIRVAFPHSNLYADLSATTMQGISRYSSTCRRPKRAPAAPTPHR